VTSAFVAINKQAPTPSLVITQNVETSLIIAVVEEFKHPGAPEVGNTSVTPYNLDKASANQKACWSLQQLLVESIAQTAEELRKEVDAVNPGVELVQSGLSSPVSKAMKQINLVKSVVERTSPERVMERAPTADTIQPIRLSINETQASSLLRTDRPMKPTNRTESLLLQISILGVVEETRRGVDEMTLLLPKPSLITTQLSAHMTNMKPVTRAIELKRVIAPEAIVETAASRTDDLALKLSASQLQKIELARSTAEQKPVQRTRLEFPDIIYRTNISLIICTITYNNNNNNINVHLYLTSAIFF